MKSPADLAPVGVELLYPNSPLGVVAAVLQPELLARRHDRVVHVDGELVGDVEDVAQLPGVGHVHREDLGGAGDVHEPGTWIGVEPISISWS